MITRKMKNDMVNTAIDNYVEHDMPGAGYAILRYIRKGWIASTHKDVQKLIDHYPVIDENGCHTGYKLLRATFFGALVYSGK